MALAGDDWSAASPEERRAMLDAARALLCGKTEREAHEARRVGDAQLPEFDDLDGRARAALARATAETARLKGA
jgi:hypothetical protein